MSVSLAELVLTDETRLMLEELEQLDHEPLETIIARAVKAYWGQRIMEGSNAAYNALRSDPQAWEELQQERTAWDATLGDGLAGAC